MLKLKCQRHLFDIPDNVAWFNCASRTPFLKSVVRAGEAGMRARISPWAWDPSIARGQTERVRELFAGLISATADDIAIVHATSYALAVAAQNLTVRAGQTILILEDQFPSNVFVWLEKAENTGGKVRSVPRPADGDWTSAVLEHLAVDTAIAALPPCHWVDGGRVDLEVIGARCRELGAALVVDATQWVGAALFDIRKVMPDFLVSSAYKWLMCPNGLAFFYVAPKYQDGQPIEHNEYNHPKAGASIEGQLQYDETYSAGARRFDMGQTLNLILLPMAQAALEQLTAWTPAAINQTLTSVTAGIAARARELGYALSPDAHRAGHMLGLKRTNPPPADLIPRLATQGVHASQRCQQLRLAPHVYISERDVELLLAALETAWPEKS